MTKAKRDFPAKYLKFQAMLAAERDSRGLTQAEVAVRLGKPQSAISKYESGELRLDMIEFIALADAVGFDPVEFLSRFRADV